MPEPKNYGARNRPHISFKIFQEPVDYEFPPQNQKRKPLREDYAAHASALIDQLAAALGNLPPPAADHRLQVQGLRPGVVVEVETLAPAADSRSKAAKIPAGMDFPTQEITVLRTERRDDRTESAVLFVPDSARTYLKERIGAYGRDPGNAKRPDMDRFEVIETIAAPSARALFAGIVDFAVPDPVWWQLWIDGNATRAQRVASAARQVRLAGC